MQIFSQVAAQHEGLEALNTAKGHGLPAVASLAWRMLWAAAAAAAAAAAGWLGCPLLHSCCGPVQVIGELVRRTGAGAVYCHTEVCFWRGARRCTLARPGNRSLDLPCPPPLAPSPLAKSKPTKATKITQPTNQPN